MVRRNVFSEFGDPSLPIHTEGDVLPEPGENSPRQPLDLIPCAEPRKKRVRDWERTHRCETVTYRGVPLEYHQLLGAVALSLSVPRDEVVRAFLEFGVKQYQCGQLVFRAFPKAQRMTLFPTGENKTFIPPAENKASNLWLDQAFPSAPKKVRGGKRKTGKSITPRWEIRVTYRIPISLKEEIRALAKEHELPVGEVVWFFLERAIQAFRDGHLRLQPVPKTVGKSLFQEEIE